MISKTILLLAVLLNAVHQSHSHSVITAANGVGGPTGYAMGVLSTTPRDGTGRQPFQTDSSIIRDGEIEDGTTGPCGRTLQGDNNDMAQSVAAMMADLGGLPQVAPGQPLRMTLHQVNADGAGPYTCDVSVNGLGTDFQEIEVTEDVGGRRGFSFGNGATPQPLVVNMPASMQCTGGPNNNMCIVRCRNSTPAGPFGGCVPVQQGAGPGAGNGNADAGAGNAEAGEGNAGAGNGNGAGNTGQGAGPGTGGAPPAGGSAAARASAARAAEQAAADGGDDDE